MPDRSSKRTGRLLAVLLSTLATLAGSGLAWHLLHPGRGGGRPANVVLISIDTLRTDHLGCYGGRPITPNIDAVARDGVRFTRVHSTNPITLPAHSSMLTGTDPRAHGVHDNHSYHLDESKLTLAEILKEKGFQTAAFVSSVVLDARFGFDQGFDVYDDEAAGGSGGIDERRGERTSQAAIEWLEEHGRRPFFLFLHYFDPHVPYAPPEPFASRHPDSPYAAEVAYVDDCIGRVTAALESMGLYDSTLLLVTADHGESLGEHDEATHSFFVYDSTIRVPLVIETPGGGRSEQVDEPAGIIDIVPTVLGLLGLPAPPQLDGVDLSPWVLGRGRPVQRDLYFESIVPAEYGCSPLRGLVRDDWKLIGTTRPELYDLAADPGEQVDRFLDRPEIASAMQARLAAMTSEPARAEDSADPPVLDPKRLARLRSLGYARGSGPPPARGGVPSGEDPKDFIGLLNRLLRADELRRGGDLVAARALSQEVQRERPGDLRSLQILGDVALLEGKSEEAVDYYSRYLAIATDTPAAAQRGGYLIEIHYNLGSALHRLHRLEEAADHFARAIDLDPDLAPAHNALGALLAQQGRLAESIEHFRRALAIDPGSTSARENLALATAKLEEAD